VLWHRTKLSSAGQEESSAVPAKMVEPQEPIFRFLPRTLAQNLTLANFNLSVFAVMKQFDQDHAAASTLKAISTNLGLIFSTH
jgi:hypothetical protein